MFSAGLIFPHTISFLHPNFFTSLKQQSKPGAYTGVSKKKDENASNLCCFSSKVPSFGVSFRNTGGVSLSEETPDESSYDSAYLSKCKDYNLLAGWLRSCCTVKEVKRIHAVSLKCLKESVIYLDNNLISAYLRMGKLADARRLFDNMPVRNVVSWTVILDGYMTYGFNDEALQLFNDCIKCGIQANSQTFVCALNLCSKIMDFELGRQIHACIIKGKCSNLIVDSTTVYFYAQFGEITSAIRVFKQMKRRDVICWTTMITAYAQHGCGEEAFSMFSRMLSDGFCPNEFTVCSVLKACGEQRALRSGRQLHSAIVKNMYKNDVFIGTSLLDMYAKCGEISDSRKVFDGMRIRNTVTWTSMIAGYARNELGEEAITLYRIMRRRKIFTNNLTIVSILRACGSVGAQLMGREVHAHLVKNSVDTNLYIDSTLIWFYCKCGKYSMASRILQQMPTRDVVSWTAMISGCAHLGHEYEALEFLKEMLDDGVVPNPYTYSSLLKACAKLENVLTGKEIHSIAKKTDALYNVFVGSALVHMYVKCGYVSEALQVFDSMPERNVVSWRTMIVGYARNGRCQEALKLMYRMQAEGIEIDDHVLTIVLNECGGIERDTKPSSAYSLPSH